MFVKYDGKVIKSSMYDRIYVFRTVTWLFWMYRNIVDNRNLSETHDPIYFRVTIDRITTLHVLCQDLNGGGDTIHYVIKNIGTYITNINNDVKNSVNKNSWRSLIK